jgi:electron transfer flavoprotein beta subunit
MNILVCVKHVPDSTADRHFEEDSTVDRVGVDGLLSELDEYAVEQALQLKDKAGDRAGDATVTVLCVGPEQSTDAVRKSLQMGCDAGVHVVDDAIAGSCALGTSLVLAEAVRKISAMLSGGSGWDVVMCGMASTDGSMGVVPTMLAERLDVPAVTLGSEVELDNTTFRIRRDGDTATETIEATLPVVCSVTDQSGEARYPSFKGIMAAKKKPVQTWSLADHGVDAALVGLSASYTLVESTQARPPKTAGQVVPDEDGTGAHALVEFLASKKFI